MNQMIVSSIIKSQAQYQFNQKKQEIIKNELNKKKNTYDKETFQNILNTFLHN